MNNIEEVEKYEKQLRTLEPILKELTKRIDILTKEKDNLENKIKKIKRRIKIKSLFIS